MNSIAIALNARDKWPRLERSNPAFAFSSSWRQPRERRVGMEASQQSAVHPGREPEVERDGPQDAPRSGERGEGQLCSAQGTVAQETRPAAPKQPRVRIEDRLRRNFVLRDNGAELVSFDSQYHHGCVVDNVLTRDYAACWFTNANLPLPQSLVIDLGRDVWLRRVGIYQHGQNNQNVRVLNVRCGSDRSCSKPVLSTTLRHIMGMHLFDLPADVKARYIMYEVAQNFGGSGSYISRLYAFGVPVEPDEPERPAGGKTDEEGMGEEDGEEGVKEARELEEEKEKEEKEEKKKEEAKKEIEETGEKMSEPAGEPAASDAPDAIATPPAPGSSASPDTPAAPDA